MSEPIPAIKPVIANSAAEVVVEARNVTKLYGGNTRALDDVSFAIKRGEFLCLLGPSGSGKTTLLRIIGGLERADSGCVLVGGRDVTSVPAAERRTNMVFQHHALFPHLSVRENIAFGPRLRKKSAADTTKRVVRVLELVRLGGYGDRMPAQLSGGQRQRVAIARAIINDPAVLLLDEPLASLDLRLRMELQDELRRLQRSLGSPFVAVTHDQHEAMALADRIAVMNAGRIEQIGTPDEIYRSPRSLFVAKFIGRVNELQGVISKVVGVGVYEVRAVGVSIPCRAMPGLAVGKRVALCIREEVIQLLAPSWNQFNGDARVAATILEKRFLGSRVKFTLRVGDSYLLAADIPAVAMDAFAVGEKVNIGWRSDQANAFPLE